LWFVVDGKRFDVEIEPPDALSRTNAVWSRDATRVSNFLQELEAV
jgi:hypothetical protein